MIPRSKLLLPEWYDGTRDPDDHIQNYMTMMNLHGAKEPLLCMAFHTILQKSAKDWFNGLPLGSMWSFKDLSHAFCNQFVASKMMKRSSANLLSIARGKKETLHN